MKAVGIDYIICAAGEGLRLQTAKFKKPKPLVKIKNLTLLERSLLSLDLTTQDQLILITQEAHQVSRQLTATLAKKYPGVAIKWVEINSMTTGQLETATLAKAHLRGQGVVIFNSDTFFRSPTLLEVISQDHFDGIIPCSPEQGNEWSFCKADDKGQIFEVAEKNRISDLASVGYYYFKKADEFLKYAQAEIVAMKISKKECYVAPVYNRFIQDGKKIGIDLVTEFKPMGTPAQILKYWNLTLEDLALENQEIVLKSS